MHIYTKHLRWPPYLDFSAPAPAPAQSAPAADGLGLGLPASPQPPAAAPAPFRNPMEAMSSNFAALGLRLLSRRVRQIEYLD